MRFFWKILLVTIPAVGGYLLYKKSSPSADTEVESEQKNENKTTSESSPRKDTVAKQGGENRKRQVSSSRNKENEMPNEEILKSLAKIDGVTSRVAENLMKKGIHSKEDLTKLSREELMEIKGIGPKRAAKILNL